VVFKAIRLERLDKKRILDTAYKKVIKKYNVDIQIKNLEKYFKKIIK